MAYIVDSKPTFDERVKTIGLGDFLDKIHEAGFYTLGDFAYSCSRVPGSGDDDKFISEVAVPILGDVKAKIPALRRLWFEAYTAAAAELRARVDRTDEDKPRKMSLPERAARRERIKPKLGGLDLQGVHECSHALEDAFSHMRHETKVLQYPAWESCTTRSEENRGQKSAPEWKPDAHGVIKETKGESTATTKAATEYQLHNLFIRRGIAAETGGVMLFESHQKLSTRLMQSLTDTPPPGYAKTSFSQVRRADEMAWRLLEQATHQGIEAVSETETNVDKAMDAVLVDTRFTMLLMPLPDLPKRPSDDNQQLSRKQRRLAAQTAAGSSDKNADMPWNKGYKGDTGNKGNKGDKGKGKGKNKGNKGGKDKGKNKPASPMPRELMGGVAATDENDPICFGFNCRAGCALAAAGAWCWRGKHVCCSPGCFQPGPFHKHSEHAAA